MSRGAALRQAPPLLRAVKRYWEPPRGAGEALSLGCMMWGASLFATHYSGKNLLHKKRSPQRPRKTCGPLASYQSRVERNACLNFTFKRYALLRMANNTQNTLSGLYVCAAAMGRSNAPAAPGVQAKRDNGAAGALLELLCLFRRPLGKHGEMLVGGASV